jgi:hypothetical protein
MLQKCSGPCQRVLEVNNTNFCKNKRSKNGWHYKCKQCHKKLHQEYYMANKEAYLTTIKKRRQSRACKINKIKIELGGCVVCKELTPCCLDFHHPNKDKENEISNLVRKYSWEAVIQEMKKCILLCANCHRKLHNNIIQCPLST